MKKLFVVTAMTAMIGLCLSAATWEKTYPELNDAYSIFQTNDGGYAFTGLIWLEESVNLYIAKVDSWGNLLWYKYFHRSDYDGTIGLTIKETPDEGLAVLGTGNNPSTGQPSSFWLLRTDSNGDTLWTRNYGGEKSAPEDMDICPDSGFIMTGLINPDDPTDNKNILLIRTDKNGSLLWEKDLGGYYGTQVRARENGFDLLADSNGIWFLKLDNNGDTLWTKRYPYPNQPGSAAYFGLTNDNGYIIMSSPADKLSVIKTNEYGNIEWEKNYQPERYLGPSSVNLWQTNDSGYFLIYNINEYIWSLKLNVSGDSLWTKSFSGLTGSSCWALDAKPTSDQGMIIAGVDFDSLYAYLIKTDENGNIGVEENFPHPEIFTIRVGPNPSRGYIRFETDSPNPVHLKIYDIAGRLVKETQVEKSLKMNLPSGVFFWQTEKVKGKFIVVK